MPAARRNELIRQTRVEYRWGEPGQDPVLVGLDSKHGYLRFHGSPSEESRAIAPLSVLFAMHLEDHGWTWAVASDNAVTMLSPDGRRALRLGEAVGALLDRDDTDFSWLSRQLLAGGAVELRGVVEL